MIEIGTSAFANCSDVTYLCLGNSVKTIGASAFINCNNIASVTIPQSVKAIYFTAFRDCSNLNEVIFEHINGWTSNHETREEVTFSGNINADDLFDSAKAAKLLKENFYSVWRRND